MTNPSPSDWKRDIFAFLASQVISLFGSSLVQYAIVWYITLETKSGTMMAISIICGFVPTFLLSPFAGVWADRHDRKKLVMLADGGIASATFIIAMLFLSGWKDIWLLFVALAVRAAGSAIHGPAVGALIPQIVPADKLTRVNGFNGALQSVMMLFSPVLSAALLTFTKIEVIFFIDVLTAVIGIGVLGLFLRIPPHGKALNPGTSTYVEDMKLGYRYIRDHKYLVSFFMYMGLLLFMIAPAAFLTPLQTTRTFGPDVWRLTAIEIIFSSGMILGGVLIGWLGGFRNRMHTMAVSNLVMAACTVALGLVPSFWIYLVFMGIFGIALPFFNTPSAVILQEHVEPDFLGRVFSVMTMLSTSLMPLGMLIFGPLADVIRIEWILVGTGAGMLVLAFSLLASRRLLEAGVRVSPGIPFSENPSAPAEAALVEPGPFS